MELISEKAHYSTRARLHNYQLPRKTKCCIAIFYLSCTDSIRF